MSYDNIDFPPRRPFHRHVEDATEPANPDYINSQREILRSQRQEEIGHVPPYISMISTDNIIQQARYHVIAPNSRNNNRLLQAYPFDDTGSSNPPNTAVTTDANQDRTYLSSLYTGPNKDYNPYLHYLQKRGLLNDNYKTRIYTHYLNIDSRYRNSTPSLTTENQTLLTLNPLTYTANNNTNLLTINAPNTLTPGDKITLTGITTPSVSIKALYQYINMGTPKTGFATIFENGKTTLIIKTDYATSVLWNPMSNTYFQEPSPETANMSFDPNFAVGNGIPYATLKAYNTTDMYVDLSGFTGLTIGNISTNFLNSTHRIYLTNPDPSGDVYINTPNGSGIVPSITGFYILLPTTFSGPNPPITDTNMTIDINFRYIGGIPINKLNANIPITTTSNINGFFTVYSATPTTVNIKLSKQPYYISPITLQPIPFGGDSVFIAKITNIDTAFPNQNNYVIDLPKSYRNVFMIKLINTIFPNTTKAFRTGVNDKLYWQNLDDGPTVYSIVVPSGTYTANELESLLERLMYAVVRVGSTGGYTNRVVFDVDIDPETNLVTFKSYKEADLRLPIQSVVDANGMVPTMAVPGNPPYTLVIGQPGHNLSIGDMVRFTGLMSTLGIPDTALNGEHVVTNVIDLDHYEIMIDRVNLVEPIVDSMGGFAGRAFVANVFRLLFDRRDTIGRNLGFRLVGDDIAVTGYGGEVTNADAYADEVVVNDGDVMYTLSETGQLVAVEPGVVNLAGEEYVLMVVREFGGSTDVGENKKVLEYFAKINVEGRDRRLIDTFVCAPVLFYDMPTLNQLSVRFYGPNDKLFDFGGLNHSFVLEVTSLELMPQETGIDSTNNFI